MPHDLPIVIPDAVAAAVDPGVSGGVAVLTGMGRVVLYNMPDTPLDKLTFFRMLSASPAYKATFMENVGHWRPGDSVPGAIKFARQCGHLDVAIAATLRPLLRVAPGVWIKKFLGNVPKESGARKNAIKDRCQQLQPTLHITLATADALGILLVVTGMYRTGIAPRELLAVTQYQEMQYDVKKDEVHES